MQKFPFLICLLCVSYSNGLTKNALSSCCVNNFYPCETKKKMLFWKIIRVISLKNVCTWILQLFLDTHFLGVQMYVQLYMYLATFYIFRMYTCLKSSFWIISGSSCASLKLNTFPDLLSSKKVHSCHLTRKKNAIIPSRTKWMARSVYFSSWKCRGNDAVWIPNYRILCWHTSRNEA